MALQCTDPSAGTREHVRILPIATLLVIAALCAFAVNFVAATGGHCGDDGCGEFPEWLYVASGWLVLLSLAALLLLLVFGLVHRLRR